MNGAELSIGPLLAWVAGLSLLLSFGTTVWNMVNSGSKQNSKRIADVETRLGNLERENQRLGDKVLELPDKDMMHRVEISLARMEGHIDRLDERLRPVTAIAERMQDLLIEQGRK